MNRVSHDLKPANAFTIEASFVAADLVKFKLSSLSLQGFH